MCLNLWTLQLSMKYIPIVFCFDQFVILFFIEVLLALHSHYVPLPSVPSFFIVLMGGGYNKFAFCLHKFIQIIIAIFVAKLSTRNFKMLRSISISEFQTKSFCNKNTNMRIHPIVCWEILKK